MVAKVKATERAELTEATGMVTEQVIVATEVSSEEVTEITAEVTGVFFFWFYIQYSHTA